MIRDTLEGLNEIADHFAHAANVLEHRAKLSEAEAEKALHAMDAKSAKEHQERAKRQRTERAIRLKMLDFARSAIALLKPKATRASFHPPTKGEVVAYAHEIKLPSSEADAFIDFYTSKEWRVGHQKMSDWKAALRNWKRRKDAESKKHAGSATEPITKDHPRWAEFLRLRNTPYVEQRYAPQYLRTEFTKLCKGARHEDQ